MRFVRSGRGAVAAADKLPSAIIIITATMFPQDFELVNAPKDAQPRLSSSGIILKARPPTDLWRKPPNTNVEEAPMMLTKIPITSFNRARVTVHAEWKREFDQGGLVLLFPPTFPGPYPGGRKDWVKTGIEFFKKPQVSTVAANDAADWSIVPGLVQSNQVTIEVEREADGPSLWVYVIDGEERTPVREITWVFSRHPTGDMHVGVYAARPTLEGDKPVDKEDELVVYFEDFTVE